MALVWTPVSDLFCVHHRVQLWSCYRLMYGRCLSESLICTGTQEMPLVPHGVNTRGQKRTRTFLMSGWRKEDHIGVVRGTWEWLPSKSSTARCVIHCVVAPAVATFTYQGEMEAELRNLSTCTTPLPKQSWCHRAVALRLPWGDLMNLAFRAATIRPWTWIPGPHPLCCSSQPVFKVLY